MNVKEAAIIYLAMEDFGISKDEAISYLFTRMTRPTEERLMKAVSKTEIDLNVKSKVYSQAEGLAKAIKKSEQDITVTNDGKTYMTFKEAEDRVSDLTKPFRTKWMGAWKGEDSEYAHTPTISKEILTILPDAFRIVLKKNKRLLKQLTGVINENY